MTPDAVVGDSGVSLLPLLPEHVDARYVSWLNDPQVTYFTEVTGVHAPDATRAYVQMSNQSAASAMWRIISDNDLHIGNIRLSNINQRHARADVALLIGDKDYWGRGVGTKVISMVSTYAFSDLKLEKLSAGLVAENVGSYQAFLKAGFDHEATLKDHAILDGVRHDVHLMCRFADSKIDA